MKSDRTRSQERILQLLKQFDREISAQDIYIELRTGDRGVGLATIYRALESLRLDGSIQSRILSTGESLYSCVQADRHHLTCLHCGRSIPIADAGARATRQVSSGKKRMRDGEVSSPEQRTKQRDKTDGKPFDECPVKQLEQKLESCHQFKIYYHTLEFFGVCQTCDSTTAVTDYPVMQLHHHHHQD